MAGHATAALCSEVSTCGGVLSLGSSLLNLHLGLKQGQLVGLVAGLDQEHQVAKACSDLHTWGCLLLARSGRGAWQLLVAEAPAMAVQQPEGWHLLRVHALQ